MDFKELAKEYEVQIEGWHLFYENFNDYDLAISVMNGVLTEMMSELLKAKSINPNNEKIKATENRLDILFGCVKKMNGLNNSAFKLNTKLKKVVANQLKTELINEDLKSQIAALKASFND